MLQIIATLIAAMSALAGCVTALASLRNSRKNSTALGEVHVLVNSRLKAVIERVDQLTRTLEDADVRVPLDPAHAPKATDKIDE